MYEPINDIMEIIGTLRNTKFKCKICEKEIIEKTNFKMHMKNVHRGIKKIQMWWLWQKFHSKYRIEGTYYMKKRFNCDECGKYFYNRESNLRVHIQIVHEKDF